MPSLQQSGDDPVTRCTFCSEMAAGPCASCKKPVCGDCSTLTEGGAKLWAICLDCDRRGGRSLRAPWIGLLLWMLGLLVALALLVGMLGWISMRLRGQH